MPFDNSSAHVRTAKVNRICREPLGCCTQVWLCNIFEMGLGPRFQFDARHLHLLAMACCQSFKGLDPTACK